MSDAEMVPVTQAARDAAADLHLELQGLPSSAHDLSEAHLIRAGEWDGESIVQAFARARLAAEAAAIEECADLAETQTQRTNRDPDTDEGQLYGAGYENACADCATAIRSLKEGASHTASTDAEGDVT